MLLLTRRTTPLTLLVALALLAACAATPARPAPTVITAAGPNPDAIRPQVEAYRQLLGMPDNGGEPGSKPTGHRSINWDGLSDAEAAPADYAPDLFNQPAAPRARGAMLGTAGSGLVVSADADNPGAALPRFGHINPSYAEIFQTFSGERLFSPVGSNVADLTFFVPGTQQPALVRGFGAVYVDVDTDHTAFEYFDKDGNSLGSFNTPTYDRGLSFLGVAFDTPIVARVRITYGTVALGPEDSAASDVSVMDDFIYGEPQAIP